MWEAHRRKRESWDNGGYELDDTSSIGSNPRETRAATIKERKRLRRLTTYYTIFFWFLNVLSICGIITCFAQEGCAPSFKDIGDTLGITLAGIEVAFWGYLTFKTGWDIVDTNRHQINWSCRCLTFGVFTICRAIMVAVIIYNPKCKGKIKRCICESPRLVDDYDLTFDLNKLPGKSGEGDSSWEWDRTECPEDCPKDSCKETSYNLKCRLRLVCVADLDRPAFPKTSKFTNKSDPKDSHEWDDEDKWDGQMVTMGFSFGLSLIATIASFSWFVGASKKAIHNDENKIAWKLYLQMAVMHVISMFVANMAAYNVFDDFAFPGASMVMILGGIVGIILFNWRFSGDDCGDICSCCVAMLPNKEEAEEYNPDRDSKDYSNYIPSNTPYAILEGNEGSPYATTGTGTTTARHGHRS